ncbi:MAG: beta-methylgalactoside transporter, partial [Tissierellia bacterium]|nr:beta-methylgalactoside transporter [Tissierellia bacterium]
LAGLMYGLAGYLLTAKTGSVGPGAGQGYELEAIASATIGGVSTAGGQGTVPGILLGVFVFELLKISLSFLGVSPDMTNVIQGIVIVIAVALDVRRTLVKR